MLRSRQIETLRESLRYDLDRRPRWADLHNLHGLLATYEGDLDSAKSSFEGALENLRCAHALAASPSSPQASSRLTTRTSTWETSSSGTSGATRVTGSGGPASAR